MRKGPGRFTRRTLVVAVIGLAFAAAAGIGLAQITTGSAAEQTVSATASPATGTQTAGERETESADLENRTAERETEAAEIESVSSAQLTSSVQQTTTGLQTETGAGQQKVVVCHHTGSVKHPFHTITVAAPAVPAHEGHGDEVGAACPTTTTAAATTVAPTQTTTATTTAHHGPKPKTNHASDHATGHGHASGHGHGNSGHAPKAVGHGKGK
jgi:hypothetical protein